MLKINCLRLRIQTSSASSSSSSSGSSSLLDPPPREECRVKNLKQQQRMSMAKLDAHRCLVRDTVVALPAPDDVIADYIQPSHVVVPRCTGEREKSDRGGRVLENTLMFGGGI